MAERSVHIRIAVKDLEAARARLASLGVEGEEALNKIERGGPRAAAGLDQVDRAALRAGRNMRFALGNAAAQIQDVVVSLQAGQRPLTVLIQQGSQLASAFGPVGVILGTVGALLVAGVGAWIGYRDATEEAGEETKRFEATQAALQAILGDTTQKIHDQADAIADLRGASRDFGVEALHQQLALANANLEREKNALTTTLGEIESAILRAGEARSLGSPFGQGQPDEIRPGVLDTLAAIQEAQAGGDLEALTASVVRLAREMNDPALAEFGEKLTKSGLSAEGARREIDAVNKALQDLAQGTTQSAAERTAAETAAAKATRASANEVDRLAAAEAKLAERRQQALLDLQTQVDQAERMLAAEMQGADAAEALAIAIEGENAARRAGLDLSTEQGRAIAAEAVQLAELKNAIDDVRDARRQAAAAPATNREAERAAREAERERERLADQAARELQRPFDNAANNIQNTMTDVFEEIYSGAVTNFEDIADAATQIFRRLMAELTTLLILRPQLLMGGGVGGAGSSLASQLGFAGAGAAGTAGVANLAAGTPTSRPVTGPGGLLVGGGVTSSSGAPAPGGFFSAGTLQGGLAGVGVGTVAGGLAGGSQTGALIGSTAGALAGGIIGSFVPVIGTAIGAFAGGALGGLIGGFVGGSGGGGEGAANNTGRLSFGTTAGSGGPFGRLAIGGDTDFVSALAPMIQQFDEGVAQFLTTRQEDAVGNALQALEEFTGRFSEADPSKAFQAIIEQRTRTVLATGFPGISADAVLEGNTGVEDIASRLQTALQTQQQVTALTQAQGAGATLRRELEEIADGFDELRANAIQYGIAIDGLTAAENRAIKAAKDAVKEPVRQRIFELTQGGTPEGQLRITIRQIRNEFDDLRETANALGISTKGLAEAEEQRIKAAREQAAAIDDVADREADLARQRREERQALALSVPARFDALADPLTALRTQIRFENQNPTQQFEAARKDFERLVRQSERGNLEAIAQLPGAAQLFRDLAGRFGASPLQAEVDKQILRSITDVLSTVREAQQEASRGMVGAINRASNAQIDTLKELIAETREVKREIRRLGREARVA